MFVVYYRKGKQKGTHCKLIKADSKGQARRLFLMRMGLNAQIVSIAQTMVQEMMEER